MPRIFRPKRFALLLITALLLPALLISPAMAAGTYPYSAGDTVISDALNYLSSLQDSTGKIESFSASAWVVMAIAAAGEDPDDWKDGSNPSIVDYLEANAASASEANAYSKMIMAAAAAGQDPTDFGGRDFVALLEAEHNNNQIGDDTLLNDDFWGVLALIAAGGDPATSDAIQDSVAFILANQSATDGGWSWGVGQDSDVDDTAAAIMALIAAGQSASSTAISNGLEYIAGMQMDNGGFESWGSTNADTNTRGISAIAAASQDPTSVDWESGPGNDPVDNLLTFQQDSGADEGAFYWQNGTQGMSPAGTTAAAIIALVGGYFPVAVLEPTPPEPGVTVNVRVEGEDENIWYGSVTVDESWITADNSDIEYHLEDPTALGALDEAAEEGEFTYTTTDEWGGLYVTSIDGEEPEGMAGWMYRVDYISPSVGADQFILDETTPPNPPHQEVLFYYGEWDDIPLKLEVDIIAPDAGDSFTVTVSEYDEGMDDWYTIEGATVYADTEYTTDENGEVEITIYHDTTIDIYAEMDDHIRSNPVTVTVGEGSSQEAETQTVSMTVDIIPAISFSVDPDYINFGVLGPRDVSDPVTIHITNEGAWKLAITTTVSDDAENLYVDGLAINSTRWNNFEGTVRRDHSEEFTVTLTVPDTYTETGNQNGTIIFWASESPY
jgi:hypothetical protein